MKIGISTSSIERKHIFFEGIGHYTEHLVNELPHYGVTVERYAFPQIQQLKKIHDSHTFPHSYEKYLLLSKLGLVKAYTINPNVNVFHITDYRAIPMSCPTIVCVWDAINLVHPEWSGRKIRQKIKHFLVKNIYQRANKIITASEHASYDVQRHYGIKEENIAIIPWCIHQAWHIRHSKKAINEIKEKYKIHDEYIITVGTLQPRKNIGRIIDAFVDLPHAIKKPLTLVIVGKYGWQAKDVLKRLHRYQPTEKIVWLSSLTSDHELRILYHGAKLCLFPSLYEGFGMPVLEAFASRTPLITSNTTSIPEICGDAAVQINPYSTSNIKAAMIDVLSDITAQKELINAGLEQLKLFKEEKMFHKFIKIYKALS